MGITPPTVDCDCDLSHPYPAHVYVCQAGQAVNRPHYTHRHNMVCTAVTRYMREAGAVVHQEPSFLSESNKRRPDMDVLLDGKTYLVDVSVVHSTASSYRDQVIRSQDHAVKQAEMRKRAWYDEMAKAIGATVVPIVIDSLGGMGKDGLAFFQLLTAHAADPVNRRGWTVNGFTDRITWAVQCAVHKGNARIVYKKRAQQGARRRAGRSWRGGRDVGGA
jgi:hypothetical protein